MTLTELNQKFDAVIRDMQGYGMGNIMVQIGSGELGDMLSMNLQQLINKEGL